ncbi:hypothetical protein V494_07137 [Pseudogymnoascus sp. VKM F-4513 (FW-928)]|nr:hypothetical protein V494_07137 [Pseudogymnoascus sp. VKM F-4513 (FW-928)]
MAPSFLKDLRRRSKASFRTEKSTDSSNLSNGTVPTSKSSSTLGSAVGSQTPPDPMLASYSDFQSQKSPLPSIRPQASASPSPNPGRRNGSVSGMAGLGSPNVHSALPVSPYAPRIHSISDGAWVNQKVLLVHGTVGDAEAQAVEGNISLSRLDDDFPAINWPVTESHFKALVYLTPGMNKLRFDFSSPKLANSNSTNPIHSTFITVHMMPMANSPPLQLVILLGKDSPATFDSTPARIEQEGNGLDVAIKKFRMAAYLWQAFTAEQMFRNKMGRRCFRFEEEWQTGTANYRDREEGTMRNEAKIHVIRSNRTVAEIRSIDRAQQNPSAKMSGDLFKIAGEAVEEYFKPSPGQHQYVSVLILDAHWDKGANLVTGHAALGGTHGRGIHMGIFGSHALHSYPTSLEEVVPAFTDCTRTDTNYVANDANQSGSSWEAANIGIGAHLHETGHLFGCPHQENGIMLRDYVTFNRTFTSREPFSVRTNEKGGLVLPKDECGWHRLDCLRFRNHPCFRIVSDPKMCADRSIHAWPVDSGNVLVTANSGVAYIEIFTEGDDLCHQWIEYGDGNGRGPIQRQVVLTELDLRGRLPDDRRSRKIKLAVKSIGGESTEIEDFGLLASKASMLKLKNGQVAFRGAKLGRSQTQGSESQEIIFDSVLKQTKLLTQIKFYHGFALDGIEFIYEDTSTQLIGKRGGKEGGSDFYLDTRRGECILGFYVRSGFWIDGIQLLTSAGRKSEIYGNAHGGSGHTLIPPRGYSVAGISGSCGQWMDGLSLIITR